MSLFDLIKYSHINENSSIADLHELPTGVLYPWLHTMPNGDYTCSTENIVKLRKFLLEYEEDTL